MTTTPSTPYRAPRRRRLGAGLAAAAMAAAVLTGCSSDGRTQIVFFQFKPEAQAYFRGLVAEFERTHPDIDVVLDNPADSETALRTRLVKDDVPDVMTLNANATFGELASAGIFRDFSSDDVLDDVNPAYLDVIGELGEGSDGEVNAVPFAANASGFLWNPDLFAEYDVEVPTTFSELLDAAETFRAAGVIPFYGMLGDNWTPQSPLAPLSAQLQPADFLEQRFRGETTFAQGWRQTADELATLFEYTQPDPLSKGYADGTAAFARGESAMLLLGSYAVPQIRANDPAFEVRSAALPATDDPDRTTLVSGVDVAITVGRETEHPAEAMELVEFLMQPEVMQPYCEDQVAIPTLEGLRNDDPALADVQPYIDEGRIVGFTDHQFIPAIPLAPLLQELVVDGDVERFLRELDDSWDRVAERRTWGLGRVVL